jgi:hypothetical protein
MIGSLHGPQTAAGASHPSGPASGTTELAHAFDRAHHNLGCTGRQHADSFVDLSSAAVTELTEAVRAFVSARRADGSPPERILATIKSVTRPCLVEGVDEVRGDRLQAIVLHEFLASYYDVATPVMPEPSR